MVDNAQLIEDLSGIVGQGSVVSGENDIAAFAVDGKIPRAVAYPKNTPQVSGILRYANEKNLGVVPWGSGSKICMGNPPARLDLVVCTRRMNHMKDVDVANLTVTVEAGVKFLDIQARVATEEDRCYLPIEELTRQADEMICSDRSHSGCFLPIDAPYSCSATIGGVIASNSSGPRRLLYTLPRDLILGIRFVAPTGEIIGSGGKTVKNVSGYDLSKLMVGSAGSLGILCEMTLRLLPLPETMETLLFSFDDFSGASAFAEGILNTRLLPAAVEVINAGAFEYLGIDPATGFFPGAYVVAVALETFTAPAQRMRNELKARARSSGIPDPALFGEDAHRLFWLGVSDLNPAAAQAHPRMLTLQMNYPISRWIDTVKFAVDTLTAAGIAHTLLVHAGSGVCAINLLTGAEQKAVLSAQKLLDRCRESQGNLVVHRAPAELKSALPVWGSPGSDFPVMKRIKQMLDPKGIMSPGRYVGGL